MPWVQHWVPTPSDKQIEVLLELQEGAVKFSPKRAIGRENGLNYYYCQYCGGWIQGKVFRCQENTLAPLAGRRGTVESCIRCGEETGFFGMIS